MNIVFRLLPLVKPCCVWSNIHLRMLIWRSLTSYCGHVCGGQWETSMICRPRRCNVFYNVIIRNNFETSPSILHCPTIPCSGDRSILSWCSPLYHSDSLPYLNNSTSRKNSIIVYCYTQTHCVYIQYCLMHYIYAAIPTMPCKHT